MQETKQQYFFPSYWDRILSRVFDNIIFVAVGYVLSRYYTSPDSDEYQSKISEISVFLFAVRWFVYYPLMEANGGTIGKRLQGLKTISTRQNKPANFIQGYAKVLKFMWPLFISVPLAIVLGYNGLDTLEIWVIAVPSVYCVYIFYAIPGSVDANNQGKHDKAAQLMVIKSA